MKQYFYSTLLLLAGTSLYAMEESEVNAYSLDQHADNVRANRSKFSQDTSNALDSVFNSFEFEECDGDYSSIKTVRFLQKAKTMSPETISLAIAQIPFPERNSEEKCFEILKTCNATSLKTLRAAEKKRAETAQAMKEHDSRFEKKSLFRGLGALSISTLSTCGIIKLWNMQSNSAVLVSLSGWTAFFSFIAGCYWLNDSWSHKEKYKKEHTISEQRVANAKELTKAFGNSAILSLAQVRTMPKDVLPPMWISMQKDWQKKSE